MSDIATVAIALGVLLVLCLVGRALFGRRNRPRPSGDLERRFDELATSQQRGRDQSNF